MEEPAQAYPIAHLPIYPQPPASHPLLVLSCFRGIGAFGQVRCNAGQGYVAQGNRKETGKAFSAGSLHGRVDEFGSIEIGDGTVGCGNERFLGYGLIGYRYW